MTVANFVMETLLAWTSEQGSRQLVYSAIGERDNEDHMKGAFVSKAKVVEPSDFVLSEEGQKMQDNVWVCVCPCYNFTVRLTCGVTEGNH